MNANNNALNAAIAQLAKIASLHHVVNANRVFVFSNVGVVVVVRLQRNLGRAVVYVASPHAAMRFVVPAAFAP